MDVDTSANEVETGPSVFSGVRASPLTGHSCPLDACIHTLVQLSVADSSASVYLLHFVMAGF